MLNLFLISLVPLVLFAIINYYSDLKNGVLSGIIGALFLAAMDKYLFDDFDYEILIMISLLLIMGYWSIRTKNELYFKLQPALTNFCSVIILAWYQFFDQPLFLKYIPKMEHLLSPEQFALLSHPRAQAMLVRMTGHGMLWILLHGLLLAWAAKYASTKVWLTIKALFLPYFLGTVFVTELLIGKFT